MVVVIQGSRNEVAADRVLAGEGFDKVCLVDVQVLGDTAQDLEIRTGRIWVKRTTVVSREGRKSTLTKSGINSNNLE